MILTLEDIRKLCTESSFERGKEYFKMGRVINLKQLGDKITATVKGTDDYQITIYTEKNVISAACTCPYNWGGLFEREEMGFGYLGQDKKVCRG